MKYQIFGFVLFAVAIFGPPAVSGLVIDTRYPDYIVDPLVDCPTEGFFQHPRNCSWFYRCHISENLTDSGLFRRDYFECAPGTSFSNEIGICDFESWETCNYGSCDSCNSAFVDYCESFDVCPDVNSISSKVSVVLCKNPIYACENCADRSPCRDGGWIVSNSVKRHSHAIQRQSSGLFECMPSPSSMVCPPPPCDDCYISTSRCQTTEVCPNGGPKTNMTLCPKSTKFCDPCGTEENVCPSDQQYSMERASCFPPASDPSMHCSVNSQLQRDSNFISQAAPLKKYPTFQCSAQNVFPNNPWIKERFCKNYQPCSGENGLPSGVIELCTSFYECFYSVADDSWKAVKGGCDVNKLFSYEAETCVIEPKNICRVF